MSDKILEKILLHKVVVIVRKTYGEQLVNLAQAMYDGGIRLIEVTFDQADKDNIQKTSEAVSLLNERMPADMEIGAGTVLSQEQVCAAAGARAGFIISPNVNKAVIEKTKELGLISIPGAMTPTEILQAHEYGADIVKLFPAGYLGMRYIKDILAPISHVKLLATAGVNETLFSQLLDAGIAGVGISGQLTDKTLIAQGRFSELRDRAKVYVDIASGIRKEETAL